MPRTKQETQQKKETPSLSIPVYNLKGEEIKTIDLPKELFAGGKTSSAVLAQYMRVHLANKRQGTLSTKTRGEVVGTTKKVWRQKGTGRARHGSRKAPIFIGGGITFGPKPRDFSLRLNKKQKRKALVVSLSQKVEEKAIAALSSEFLKIEPKTKIIAQFLKQINGASKKILLVVPHENKSNIVRAGRNIPDLEIVEATTISPHKVLQNKMLLFIEDAVPLFVTHFSKSV